MMMIGYKMINLKMKNKIGNKLIQNLIIKKI